MPTQPRNQVPNKIILHVTDSPDERDIGLKEINQWHKERDFTPYMGNHCGYHYIIRRLGEIEVARPEIVVGVHTAGQNRDSIAIVWVGRDTMTEVQKRVMLELCADICERWVLKPTNIYGHTSFNSKKTCPNFRSKNSFASMEAFRELLTLELVKRAEYRENVEKGRNSDGSEDSGTGSVLP